jgi:hypothetical protein
MRGPRRIALLVTAMCVGLAGCGTKYQEMGFTGGVAAERVTGDTVRITARGNAYTSGTTIQDYALLKAAETTKEMGGSHFAIISAADASRRGVDVSPGVAQTTITGNTAITTYSPGTATEFIKPGQDAYIRVLRLAPGGSPPPGAISADEIIQFVGARVRKA